MADISWIDQLLYHLSTIAWWIEAHPGFALGLGVTVASVFLLTLYALVCAVRPKPKTGLVGRICNCVSEEVDEAKKARESRDPSQED